MGTGTSVGRRVVWFSMGAVVGVLLPQGLWAQEAGRAVGPDLKVAVDAAI
jgi:hypothetical protein